MSSAAEQVDAAFTKASSYASAAQSAMTAFTTALNAAIYAPPTLSFAWTSLAAPNYPALPAAPTMPIISYTGPASTPGPLAVAEPSVVIDDFNEAAPALVFPDAPVVSYGAVPGVPSPAAVGVPAAPVLADVGVPNLIALADVAVPAIDLRSSWLDKLAAGAPSLVLLDPTPYSYALGPEYASSLLAALKAKLLERMNGGTGLPAAIEQAIWDRLRDRETQIADANVTEVARAHDALGYQLPAGVISAQLRQAQQDYYDKLSTTSRDIAIKQAELEQSNLRDTITAGMQLESQLIDYAWKLENLSFESAKAYAENAIQVHNAAVEKYRALVDGYRAFAQAYETVINGQMAVVNVYRGQLEGEQIKANINTQLVEQYKARIQAGLAQAEIYRIQVQAAQTLIELERTKIMAAGEQIRAYVAQVNAETSKVEAYKASVEAQRAKADVYGVQVHAFQAKVGAQAERARADYARYSALITAKTAEWDGYRAQVTAEAERIRALGVQSGALLDAYKASTQTILAQAELANSAWKTSIAQYEASSNIALQTTKINNDAIIMTNNARLDAAKAGAQVYAQLAASAYSMIHASAGVQGNSQMGVFYSYSNDTTGAAPTITAI